MKTANVVRSSLAALVGAMILVAMTALPHAQRGGGRGGGGSSGGEFGGYKLSRLEILTNDFGLNKDQKKAVKALLDDAHKGAASTREGLLNAHAAIGAAITANKGQAEIDAAVKQYGQQAAAMATLEMKTLADLMQQLEPAQRSNGSAVRSAFFLMRGAFLDAKGWDKAPDARGY
jgi:Spy/CpxP family protein refolding chaperone